jgi:thymidylate synthase ThyX
VGQERTLHFQSQEVEAYAHLPKIRHPNGSRVAVDDPDLWFASKINATLKPMSASEVYWERKEFSIEDQKKFIRGVRNHSWNRQHMGAMVVSGIDFETVTSSLVSSTFVLGKFYRMQQQTRRSVVLDTVIQVPELDKQDEVTSSYQDRFEFYWDIVDKRPDKVKGFDPYIQDSFKILPLATKTRFCGNLDLRTVKGYCRWKQIDYLPSSVKDFSSRLYDATINEYPIMFESFLLDQNNQESENYKLQLQMAERIGSNDLIDESLLWYSDTSFLLPENQFFNKLYSNLNLNNELTDNDPNAMILGYFNPLGLSLDDLLDLFSSKGEQHKSAMELASFAFISKIDLSGAIDTWRHTRSNRLVQPIYHALQNGADLSMPTLYQRQQASGSELPDQFMEKTMEAVDLYHKLVKEGISQKEAINVLPHNLMLIQVEMMDIFGFLNLMSIRTCVHARPDVQIWAKALLREAGKTKDFSGIDQLSLEKSNLLARGIIQGYCCELGSCTKCGKEIIYLPDPFRN